MRKRFVGLIGVAMAVALCLGGCSEGTTAAEPAAQEESQASVKETDVVAIDGIYVDDSYVSEESDQLKRVYLFYTLSPDNENLEADSKYTEMTIADGNTYECEFYPGACDLMSSYYYSSFIENVYMGDTLKVAAVFEIPAADLASDRAISLADDQIPSIDGIKLSTNDIVRCASADEIAQNVDAEGYEHAQYLREEADAAATEQVRNAINGYYWSFFANNFSYRTEFSAPNNFTTTVSGAQTAGTYTVTNGYVVLTNDANGYVVEVPYSWENGEIKLDLPAGYSVYE